MDRPFWTARFEPHARFGLRVPYPHLHPLLHPHLHSTTPRYLGTSVPQIMKSVVMAQYVPHFVGHLIYVPHVPHMWDSCGTKTRSPRDGDKFTDFWIDWDFEVLLGRPFWTAPFWTAPFWTARPFYQSFQ